MTKTKGIPVWEQYIDKIVLGVAVLLFLGYTGLQFIGSPSAVELSAREPELVGPGEIDARLREKATQIDTRLAPDAGTPIEISGTEPLLDRFRTGVRDGVAPAPQLAGIWERNRIAPEGIIEPKEYWEPRIDAPTRVVADFQEFETLPAETVQAHPELARLLPEAPYDLTWLNPAAVFDLAQVREQLRRSDPGRDVLPIPPAWTRGGHAFIVDVVVEREERVDGRWTNLTVVDPIPGQLTLRPILNDKDDKIDSARRDQILDQLAQPGVAAMIVQPEFYATAHNQWSPPDPLAEEVEDAPGMDEAMEACLQLRRLLKVATAERDRYQAKLDEECAGVPAGPPGGEAGGGGNRPPPGPGGGGEGGRPPPGPGGGGMGAGGGGPGGGGRFDAATMERCKGYRRRLDRAQRRVDIALRKLTDAGCQFEAEVQGEAEPLDLQTVDQLAIWAHDITVEIGREYRYRFTVKLYNPFFGQSLALVPEQDPLADPFTISSTPSEWSHGKEVAPPLKYFVVAAEAEKRSGMIAVRRDLGSARIEVFRFYDGRWWAEDFRVTPGERIGSEHTFNRNGPNPRTVDFGTSWFVADIVPPPDRQGSRTVQVPSAHVLLQNLLTGALSGYVDPDRQARDPELHRLRERVELADTELITMR